MKKKESNKEWILLLVGILLLAICGVLREWRDDDTEKNTVESSVSDSFSSSSKNEEEKISVTGADVKEYANYFEACRAGDFESAHILLNTMESELNDFYENNEMIKKGLFSKYDETNLNKFEKLCQNQIDAILYVYGEEIKYILGMDDLKNPDKKVRILLSEAKNDGKRIINKVKQEHPTTGSEMYMNFSRSIDLLEELVESITGKAEEKESEE